MSAASSIIDVGKSIEFGDTLQNLVESDDPRSLGSFTHSSASMVNQSTTSGGRLLDPWDDCDLEVDVADDDFFNLLKSDDMCPPALKESTVKSGWENLMESMRTAYANYVASKEHEARTGDFTFHRQIDGRQETPVSFACTGDNDRLTSVFFVIETSGYQIQQPLSCEDHLDMHWEFDMDFTGGDIDRKHGPLVETPKTLRKVSTTVVSTCQGSSGNTAWWRAFKRTNGGGEDDGTYRFYGVIHPSNDPARRDEPTACVNNPDDGDEEEYDTITELSEERMGED